MFYHFSAPLVVGRTGTRPQRSMVEVKSKGCLGAWLPQSSRQKDSHKFKSEVPNKALQSFGGLDVSYVSLRAMRVIG